MEPDVIASYTVEITVRGPEGAQAPTNKEVEEKIEEALNNFGLTETHGWTIRASSERTDR